MNISEYYEKAKEIGNLAKNQEPKILEALDYNTENDHPSYWVPKVQESLLSFYKINPQLDTASQALSMYVQGEILEDRAQRNISVKVAAICLILGLLLGWFIWA